MFLTDYPEKSKDKLKQALLLNDKHGDPTEARPIDGVGDETNPKIGDSPASEGDEKRPIEDDPPATEGDEKHLPVAEPPATEGDEKMPVEADARVTEEDEKRPKVAYPPATEADEKRPIEADPPATEGDEKRPIKAEPPATERDEKRPVEADARVTEGDEKRPKVAYPPDTEADEKRPIEVYLPTTEGDDPFDAPPVDGVEPPATEGDESISDASSTKLQVNGQEIEPELKYDSAEIAANSDEKNDPSGKDERRWERRGGGRGAESAYADFIHNFLISKHKPPNIVIFFAITNLPKIWYDIEMSRKCDVSIGTIFLQAWFSKFRFLILHC